MSARPAYTYDAWLVDIHDGDTLHCGVDLGCDVAISMTVRLYGVNAPELRTPEGVTSLEWVQKWFQTNCPDGKFVIATHRDSKEKFGRYLGTIFAPGGVQSLNDAMLAAGQAVSYLPK